MHPSTIEALTKAGIDLDFEAHLPLIPLDLDAAGNVAPIGDRVRVEGGGAIAVIDLPPVDALFTGQRQPPSFSSGPTDEYIPFFALLESTVIDYCRTRDQLERDEEMERLYRQLRRRPDGRDENPLFSYLRAAARLYMAVHDVSRAEYDANPAYRHDAAMELVFGVQRPTTIVKLPAGHQPPRAVQVNQNVSLGLYPSLYALRLGKTY